MMDDTNNATRRVYSITNAAHELDVSERTIWRMISAGQIKAISLSARRKGVPLSEIERIAQNGIEQN